MQTDNYYNRNITIIVFLTILSGCSYSLLVKNDNILYTKYGYLVHTDEHNFIIPMNKLPKPFTLTSLNNVVAYKIEGGCGFDIVMEKGSLLTLNQITNHSDGKIFKEHVSMTIAPCFFNYVQSNKKNIWGKTPITYEQNKDTITFQVSLFDGHILNFSPTY